MAYVADAGAERKTEPSGCTGILVGPGVFV
jgi:hypothetical protein